MPVPKKKRSKARTRLYHSINTRLTKRSTVVCGNCGAPLIPHAICDICGFYKGKKVMVTRSEKAQAKKARKEDKKKK